MTKEERLDNINDIRNRALRAIEDMKLECEILASSPDADEAYKKGLDEAWDLATQLIRKTSPNDLKKMGFFDHVVEHEHISALLNKFTASEALAKLRGYEARKKAEAEAVKVGDEMENIDNTNIRMSMDNGRTLIVNLISGERLSLDGVTGLTADGDVRAYYADMVSGWRVFFNADQVIYIGFEEDVSGMIERS